MPDLRKLAILVIYQDGTTDSVPVGDEIFHISYYRQLREKSEKFRTLTEGLDFDDYFHYIIELFLTNKGIIVIYNEYIDAIAKHPEYLDQGFESKFIVSLPYLYCSLEQKKVFYDTIRDYDKHLLYFARLDENYKVFHDGKEVREYVLSDELMGGSSNRGKRR